MYSTPQGRESTVVFPRVVNSIVSGTLAVPQYLLARYIVRRVWRDQSETFAQMGNVSA